MGVFEFLDKFEADYMLDEGMGRLGRGRAGKAFGSAEAARAAVVRAGGKRFMCVLSAEYVIDTEIIAERLGLRPVEYLDESERRGIFPGCQTGAEPAFGVLYGLPTLMDAALDESEYIAFPGERHERSIIMSTAEYKQLASPRIFSFAHPVFETSASHF